MEEVGRKNSVRKFGSRMSPSGLQSMIESMSSEQRQAVKDIGFGVFLELGFGALNNKLSLWLIENFDPYSRTLYVRDGKITIDREDVQVTLGLPMGSKAVKEAIKDDDNEEYSILLEQWRSIWGLDKGSPKTTKMPERILTLGAEDDFKRSFVVFVVSSCLHGHKNQFCNYKILFSLMHTSEISQMDWCQYTIDCLIDAILIWKKNPCGFTGSLLFLTLFYLDRVEFIGSQIERKAPILCCWNAKAIEERCKAELKAGNFGFGRILPPIRIKSDVDTIINDIVPVHSTTNDQGESSRKSTELDYTGEKITLLLLAMTGYGPYTVS
ncbi:uncharacterized protein LOC130590809 [Beta vulgaris subsp. vulgaris]|uniref:uncharacterized protein LOC130590809 n=1 Tax=Beta vulgaris subsp. vulgaris TaxID=3555 RepID=UPI0025469BA4|nr:uncharacterized protein LOC130590809 [Beta vulgaris subsp. vulgaris]